LNIKDASSVKAISKKECSTIKKIVKEILALAFGLAVITLLWSSGRFCRPGAFFVTSRQQAEQGGPHIRTVRGVANSKPAAVFIKRQKIW
jgi:hypothetical protein